LYSLANNEKGECREGDACRYSHDPESKTPVSAKKRRAAASNAAAAAAAAPSSAEMDTTGDEVPEK
jgi:hypothetical protein